MKSLYIMLFVFLMVPTKTWAIQGYGDAFRAKYPNSPITAGGCNTCIICHSDANNPETVNVYNYGIVWRNEWTRLEPGRTLTEAVNANAVAAFSNIEGGDADGDGQSNGAEIGTGNNPSGNGAVCPAGTTSGKKNLSSLSTDFNPNALNADCGFQEGGGTAAGMVQTDPIQVVSRGLFMLLPLFCVAYLKSQRRAYARS